MKRATPAFALVAAAGVAVLTAAASAQTAQPADWAKVKCDNYRKAWDFTMARRDRRGLGPEFLAAHAAFIASGCTGERNVCPRSKEELDLANVMVILAMNAGTASTFLPFACRKQP